MDAPGPSGRRIGNKRRVFAGGRHAGPKRAGHTTAFSSKVVAVMDTMDALRTRVGVSFPGE